MNDRLTTLLAEKRVWSMLHGNVSKRVRSLGIAIALGYVSTLAWTPQIHAVALIRGTVDAQVASAAASQATVDARATLDLSHLTAHPRLFVDQHAFASAKAKHDPVAQQLRALLKVQADAALLAGDIAYPSAGMNFSQMREVQGRVLTLALQYRLTNDRRYFERARHELLRLASLPSWNPSHFLDVGEAAFTAGTGYDWLYDDLSAEDRTRIAHAIVVNALNPSLRVPEATGSWVAGDFNWNQVCNCGLTVAALAIADREPELAQRIVQRAIQNVPKAGAVYAPDGSYPEGPSYWLYGTTFHVFCVEALRSTLGNTYGLDRLPGFLESAEFKRQMVAPTGAEYNYSDYHDEREEEPVLLWYAQQLKNRQIAAEEFKKLNALSHHNVAGPTTEERPYVTSRHVAFALLWWNPDLPAGGSPEPLHWTADGQMPVAVMRSATDNPKAAYLAIKGGSPNHSHAHMDVGSFIFEAGGVRWALDLGTEDYSLMRAGKLSLWDYSQGSSRWSTFRVGPEGHNILRFDGRPQNVYGNGRIVALPDAGSSMRNLVDLDSLYTGQVKSVRRLVQLTTSRKLTIKDKWTTRDHASDVTWQWLTHAKATATADGFTLEEQGQTLRLRASSNAKLTYVVEDVSQARASFDSPNPGVSRLIIKLHTPASALGSLTVRASLE